MAKQLSRWTAAVALLSAVGAASPAWAAGAFHVRTASCEIASTMTGIVNRNPINVPTGYPFTGMQFVANAPSANTSLVTCNQTNPLDQTSGIGGFTSHLKVMNIDGSANGNLCLHACYAVIRAGESRANMRIACTANVTHTVLGQYVEDEFDFAALSPQTEDNLFSCTSSLATCLGKDLVISYEQCGSTSTNNIVLFTDSLTYN